jgi:hypothetical protein
VLGLRDPDPCQQAVADYGQQRAITVAERPGTVDVDAALA